jgi:hypothetical protein
MFMILRIKSIYSVSTSTTKIKWKWWFIDNWKGPCHSRTSNCQIYFWSPMLTQLKNKIKDILASIRVRSKPVERVDQK